MTTKFNKSLYSISGTIIIHDDEIGGYKEVEITPLKQSKSGVYCLRNKLNGRLYIGMARNLKVRKERHFRDLRAMEHCNKLLQNDCLELNSSCEAIYDPENIFEFEVIIYCYPSQLTFWEGLLIDNLKPHYNVKKKKELVYEEPSFESDSIENDWLRAQNRMEGNEND